MKLSRRTLLKSAAASALALPAGVFAPAIAQNKPLKIGVLAPRAGLAASPGISGIRATEWAVEKFNAAGGIAGRKVEVVFEEETSPKDTIERFSKLVQQENVDHVQGIVSTGVALRSHPVAEEVMRSCSLRAAAAAARWRRVIRSVSRPFMPRTSAIPAVSSLATRGKNGRRAGPPGGPPRAGRRGIDQEGGGDQQQAGGCSDPHRRGQHDAPARGFRPAEDPQPESGQDGRRNEAPKLRPTPAAPASRSSRPRTSRPSIVTA